MNHQSVVFIYFHTDNCLYFVVTLEKDIDSLFDRLTLFTNAHAFLILKVNGVPLQVLRGCSAGCACSSAGRINKSAHSWKQFLLIVSNRSIGEMHCILYFVLSLRRFSINP